MLDIETNMRLEIDDIPETLRRLTLSAAEQIEPVASSLRDISPNVVCTVARGSSDHAATYLKYAIELTTGVPVASIGPSISSIYNRPLKIDKGVCIAISQSGASPDIVSLTKSAGSSGALSIALVNNTGSQLASASRFVVDISAGKEQSVAATKSFVASVAAGLMLLAYWTEDTELQNALTRLPEQAASAVGMNWQPLMENLINADRLFVLGRGPAIAIANEVALKFKETCQIQGEAFSSAEVLHGPVSVLSSESSVVAIVARDEAEEAVSAVADDLVKKGAAVFATTDKVSRATSLPFVPSGHPLTDPLLQVVSFYAFVEHLSRMRGLNPDAPRALSKVTETI